MNITLTRKLTKTLADLKKEILGAFALCCLNDKFSLEGHVLHFGNLNIRCDENYNILIAKENSFDVVDYKDPTKWVLIDSEDAYPDLADLARLADSCQDYINARYAGHDKYSVTWNIKSR